MKNREECDNLSSDKSTPRLSSIMLKLTVTVAVFLFIIVGPLPSGLTLEGQRVLAVVAASILLWITEALPMGVVALISIVLLAITGGVPSATEAVHGFSNPLVYFLLGVLTLSMGVTSTGLVEYIARYLMARSKGRFWILYSHLIMSFALLTFLLPSAITRGSILIPVYERILGSVRTARGSPAGKAVMLALASLNRIASTALLTGGVTPVVAAALLGPLLGGFSWVLWFKMMGPIMYLVLALGGLSVYLLHHPSTATSPVRKVVDISQQRLSRDQKKMLGIVSAVSLLWLTDSWHHLNPALPALMVAVIILSPGIGVLNWSSFQRGFPWANIFVVAASLSLANALNSSGAAAWLAGILVSTFSSTVPNPHIQLVLLMLMTSLTRFAITSIAAFLALVLPVVVTFSQQAGINPLVCGMAVTIVADSVVYYTFTGPSTIMAYERGHFSAWELLRLGLVMTVLSYSVVLLVAVPYWSILGERLVP
ncbi:SLC13 family permease [Chloroflexota bacterium]